MKKNKFVFYFGFVALMIFMLGLVYAGAGFFISNKSFPTQNYFSVNGSTGRVGIGTTLPYEKLTLEGGTFGINTTSDSLSIEGTITDSTWLNGARNVDVSGKYAYVVSADNDSLSIIDISNPSSPTWVGGISSSSWLDNAIDVRVAGKYAYVVSFNNDSLSIIDISNPSSPTITGGISSSSLTTAGWLNGAYEVYVSGRYAYVASYTNDSLSIIDISNPSSPTITGGISSSSWFNTAVGVYVSGKYAYLTSYDNRSLSIIDVSDPSSPVRVGSISNGSWLGFVRSVYVSGKYAYAVSNGNNSLVVINISNPSSPSIVGGISSSGWLQGAYALHVSGNYAYIAAVNNNSLSVIDVSNPANPKVIGGLSSLTLQGIIDLDISGKYAYAVSNSNDGFSIIDIGGIDAPAANIGDIQASSIEVWDNMDIGNNLYVRGGLNIGPGGIKSDGAVSIAPVTGVELDVEGTAECDGAGCWAVESDRAYKYNITPLNYGLKEILRISTKRFNYKSNGETGIGVIAQELEKIIPELVQGEEGGKSVGYGGLTPVLVKGIQEQQEEIEKLKMENKKIKQRNQKMIKELCEIKPELKLCWRRI